jgi:hypothetical protein
VVGRDRHPGRPCCAGAALYPWQRAWITDRSQQKHIVTARQVGKTHFTQDPLQLFLVHSVGTHLLWGMRINKLISEGADRKIWSLRDVENLLKAGLVALAAENRPQLSQYTEERRFAAAIWACDHKVLAWLDLKSNFRYEDITVW